MANALKSYALNQSPLYKVSSRRKLATLFGFEIGTLERLAANPNKYFVFKINQNGKERFIQTPRSTLEKVHRKLFASLVKIEKPDYLHSGRKKRSYITNAKVHLGILPLVKLDIRKFYPSIEQARIFRFFNGEMGCVPDVSAILARLCTIDGHLPTGSCVSQLLAFFSAKPMFDELHTLSLANGVRFSCYVDDLTWSGKNATSKFLWAAKRIVHSYGFSYHKEAIYDADQQKVVTGVMIRGEKLQIIPSRERKLWSEINDLGGVNEQERLKAINSLIGKVTAYGQIDERCLKRLKSLRERKYLLEKQLNKANLLPRVLPALR